MNPKIKIGVCGELGGDAKSIRRFNQLAIDYVSCSPFRVPGAILARLRVKRRKASSKVNETQSNEQILKLFIVSDSIGETAQRMIHATLTQSLICIMLKLRNFHILKMKRNS